MRKCPSCGEARLRKQTVQHRLAIGGQRFGVSLPGQVCRACGEEVVRASVLELGELGAAKLLADSGRACPEAFRFMRKAIGLRAADLAELLGVAPATVSRWENGRMPVEPRTFALLGRIVRDRLAGEDDTEELLRAVHRPAKVRGTLRLGEGVSVRPSARAAGGAR